MLGKINSINRSKPLKTTQTQIPSGSHILYRNNNFLKNNITQKLKMSSESTTTTNQTHINKLANEKSPYLLQHAHNPVNWFPWGEEAFNKAKNEDKPIFLSVGYSTCHWCHVMAHESFENENIAELLNDNFVNIKVDREERPDVDRIYMAFVTSTTGHGGWPMSVFMTPTLKPFFGGTYFPSDGRHGMISFPQLLNRIKKLWVGDRDRLLEQADSVAEALRRASEPESSEQNRISSDIIEKAVNGFISQFDERNGGFSQAPKFPRPVELNLLHRVYHDMKNTDLEQADIIKKMTNFTLHKMSQGGMYDHLGGGFHRYSVDELWHVPHFEKMLYDQGQLVNAYLDGYQISKDEEFATVTRQVLEYVQRDMTHEQGGFYSAEDADSPIEHGSEERHEGLFYIWKANEIEEILDQDSNETPTPSQIFGAMYDVQKLGNVNSKSDPHEEFTGKNVLFQKKTIPEVANEFNLEKTQVEEIIKNSKNKLFQIRSKRPRPHLDDKIITAWNGLMISAFARGYSILGDSSFLNSAEKATQFIHDQLWDSENKTLQRSFREGPSNINGFLSDYSFLIQGLLDLYEANGSTQWLQWAKELQTRQNELLWDSTEGSYFDSAPDEHIIARLKEHYDGAEPSGNSIAALNLQRLGYMLHENEYNERARQILSSIHSMAQRVPTAVPQFLVAAAQDLNPPSQIIISGPTEREDTQKMLSVINSNYKPDKVLLHAGTEDNRELLQEHPATNAVINSAAGIQDPCTVYVCHNFSCDQPSTDAQDLSKRLF